MIGFDLTEEQAMVRDLAREFAQNEIAPRAAHHDDKRESFGISAVAQRASCDKILRRAYPLHRGRRRVRTDARLDRRGCLGGNDAYYSGWGDCGGRGD